MPDEEKYWSYIWPCWPHRTRVWGCQGKKSIRHRTVFCVSMVFHWDTNHDIKSQAQCWPNIDRCMHIIEKYWSYIGPCWLYMGPRSRAAWDTWRSRVLSVPSDSRMHTISMGSTTCYMDYDAEAWQQALEMTVFYLSGLKLPKTKWHIPDIPGQSLALPNSGYSYHGVFWLFQSASAVLQKQCKAAPKLRCETKPAPLCALKHLVITVLAIQLECCLAQLYNATRASRNN